MHILKHGVNNRKLCVYDIMPDTIVGIQYTPNKSLAKYVYTVQTRHYTYHYNL